MTSTDDEQDYFAKIEETFVELRGSPLLLSPGDWQIASSWHARGIPLALVLTTIRSIFREREEQERSGKIQSLKYLASAVDRAWQDQQSLTAAARRSPTRELDVDKRLQVLAQALPRQWEGAETIRKALASVQGSPQVVEERLKDLDEEMLSSALSGLSESARDEFERDVEAARDRLRDRVDSKVLDDIAEELRRRALRRLIGLPLLSLFAVDDNTDS